ncbi:MAG: sulfatase-like hydrolase/transferase [Luteolibacter sp.]
MKLLSAILSVLVVTVLSAAGVAPKPNVIFILCDDLGYGDIGVFYQNLRKATNDRSEPWHFTPNLDTVAAEGLQMPHHYCPAPVCAPSRASLLLGVHQGHANVRDNQFDKALENNHTLGTVLKGAGYATACVGKWGLQGSGANPTAWAAYPTKRGFDYYYGYVRHGDGHEHYPKEGPYDGAKEVWDMNTEVSSGLDKCYTADLWTARAKKWLVDQHTTAPSQPFFLYLAYDTPHATCELPTMAYPAGGGLTGGLQWTGTPGAMINTAGGTGGRLHSSRLRDRHLRLGQESGDCGSGMAERDEALRHLGAPHR